MKLLNCIWYFVESDRFQKNENKLNNYEKINHTPVIIFLTKTHSIDHVNKMKSYLHGKDYEDIIAIMAKREKLVN
jgi:hypothetical protein